ncbi:MAG: TrmH family RNA methyltransferase, partial [Muribaculaceae bacterium]|nr:TrmH family RNA methyltransferase [Muribaculaceae bacterium]
MEKKTIWDLNRPDIEQYRHSAKAPVAVVLDNVRSLNNIGSIFRTCDGLGVAELLLCGITATLLLKTSEDGDEAISGD